LLSKLLLKLDSSFYLRELSSNLNIPFSVLYKEIENLKRIGIINVEKKGKIKLVRVNKNSNIFNELRLIMIKTVGLINIIRKY
jgi:predicted transcriptional regulator